MRAGEPCVSLDNKATAALFDDWNFSLSSLDASQVSQRYWPNAVLLPTLSNTPRTSAAMVSEYFEHFLAKRPRGRIDSRTIQTGCNVAMDVGTYTFSLMDDKGTVSEVSARYTFVYQYRDGAWKILHHHSSAMPEVAQGAAPDARVAGETPVNAAGEPAQPAGAVARKEKKAKRKEVPARAEAGVTPRARASVAPTTLAKEAPNAKAADAKGASEVKTDGEAKPADDAKAVADTKNAGDAKLSAAAKPADAKPAADAKVSTEAKPEAEPSTAREVKTAMFVNLTSSPPPSKFYPPESARRKERGHVNLKVCADGAGAVTDRLEVLKSSGSKLLDEAAITWARAATWVPATMNHRRVEGCTQVDVAFEANPAVAHART